METGAIAYVLMGTAIFFAVFNNYLLHRFSNRGLHTIGDVFWFNGFTSLGWCVILLLWAFISKNLYINKIVLFYGMIYGVILFVFLLFKTFALAEGPVALTTLIGSCGFIIATGYSVLILGEPVTTAQICGMIGLILSLYFCVNVNTNEMKLSIKWALLSLVYFIAGGSVGILYREFGASSVAEHVNGMMIFAAAVSSLLSIIGGIVLNRIRHLPYPRIPAHAWKYIAAGAMTGCIYIRINISLSNVIPNAIFFPVSNGALVMLSALVGWKFFHEKLVARQIIGLLLGLCSIIVIGCL